MMAESDPRFHMSFALDPLVLAFAPRRDARRRRCCSACFRPGRSRGPTPERASRNRVAAPSARCGQLRSGRLLVSLQLALSLPLLVGAGLLARTVYNLQRADLGFPARTSAARARRSARGGYEASAARPACCASWSREIQRIPGVRAASFSQLGMFSGGESSATIEVEGYAPKGDEDRGSALDVVGPGYFSTLGRPDASGTRNPARAIAPARRRSA